MKNGNRFNGRAALGPNGSWDENEISAQKALEECILSWIALDNGGYKKLNGYNHLDEIILNSCRVLTGAENHLESKDISKLFLLVREIVGRSPLISRMQKWPRGYQGDFETIDYIMKSENGAQPDSLAYFCEAHALTIPMVQQQRNKILEQAKLIQQVCADRKQGGRVLSLGCGSCPDLKLVERTITNWEPEIFLMDTDGDALSMAGRQLPGLFDRLTFIEGKIVEQLYNVLESPFDLILARGIFNQLDDETSRIVLRMMWERGLKPGGKVFFSNIDRNDPYRAWRTWFVSWDFNERSEIEIKDLCRSANIGMNNISIRREDTGLAHFVELRRPT